VENFWQQILRVMKNVIENWKALREKVLQMVDKSQDDIWAYKKLSTCRMRISIKWHLVLYTKK